MDTKYEEQICQAVDIIVKKRLDELTFDKTISCYIEEIIDIDTFHYKVKFQDTTFEAYSVGKSEFEIGDEVRVLIPNNDFSQKKIILEANKTGGGGSADDKMDKINPVGSGTFSFNGSATGYNSISFNSSINKGSNTIAFCNGDINESSYYSFSLNSVLVGAANSFACNGGNIENAAYSFVANSGIVTGGGYNFAINSGKALGGGYNFVCGNGAVAKGQRNLAIGQSVEAIGENDADTYDSYVMGRMGKANGDCAFSLGMSTIAKETATCALNYETLADKKYSCAVGSGNIATSTSNNLFAVGNGKASMRSNAFSVDATGIAKAASNFQTGGADYAEYFEWEDGNPNKEDRVGYFVTINNDKISIATNKDEYILGIISAAPSVIGNGDCDIWTKAFLTDDFNRLVKNENEEKILNPKYDNTKKYISRKERPEWSTVGMLGVLPVLQDGTLEVNKYATVNKNGVATKCDKNTPNSYRVIKIKSNKVAEIIFR